ncbi:MAG: hypothetical protein ACRDHM_08770 [Actinomycetota bacterium]
MSPRSVALALGVAYASLTAVELLIGEWSVGGVAVLDRTTKANLLHWVVALAMLGSFFAGSTTSRLACRTAGFLFLGLAAWGLLSAVSLGGVLGYPDAIPVSYRVLHALTAIVALVSGFRRGSQTG